MSVAVRRLKLDAMPTFAADPDDAVAAIAEIGVPPA